MYYEYVGKETWLKSISILLTIPWRCFFCGSFWLLMFRVCHAILSSIYVSLVVTYWERADLLALLYVTFYCVLSLSDGVSWVKCGTWVYRFLIFASFLTLRNESKIILCFKLWPKNCCLAHMRRKLFNTGGGGNKRCQLQYLWRSIAKMYIHACMRTHAT